MPIPRVIPCLLLQGRKLVKTIRFKKPTYVGDPINTVRIFNEKHVDELVFLDIGATPGQQAPQTDLLAEIARECFMPFAYGGGLRTLEHLQAALANGAEKVVLNTALHENPGLVREAANQFGSQSIVGSIDIRTSWRGKQNVVTRCGTQKTRHDPVSFAKHIEDAGVGELLVTSIDRDGTFTGYDVELIQRIAQAVDVPVVACGGAGGLDDVQRVVVEGGADAAGAGSLFVFQNRNRSVLINYPKRATLDELF